MTLTGTFLWLQLRDSIITFVLVNRHGPAGSIGKSLPWYDVRLADSEGRDVATGDRIDVREQSFSEEALVGELICARAVPDGESNQFIGGIFPVAPGEELEILALCEDGGGYDLCEAVAALQSPPVLEDGEDEPWP